MSTRTFAITALLAGPAVPACDPASPPEPAASSLIRTYEEATVEPVTLPVKRGRLVAGERVARIPVWPAAATIDAAVRERLPRATREAIGRSPVPVLAPADPSWTAAAELFTQPSGYALSARVGEVSLAVQASRVATLLPHVGHVPGNTRLRGELGWVTSNDGVRTASWIEHGTAYSLDLECFDADGPACGEEAVRAAVEALVYVGGAGEQGGGR